MVYRYDRAERTGVIDYLFHLLGRVRYKTVFKGCFGSEEIHMPFIVRPFDCVNKSQPRDIRQAEIIGIVIVVCKPDEIEPDIAGELPYGFGIERAVGGYGMYMQVAEEQFGFGIRAIRRYIFGHILFIMLRLGVAGFVIFKLNIICDLDTCGHDMIRTDDYRPLARLGSLHKIAVRGLIFADKYARMRAARPAEESPLFVHETEVDYILRVYLSEQTFGALPIGIRYCDARDVFGHCERYCIIGSLAGLFNEMFKPRHFVQTP